MAKDSGAKVTVIDREGKLTVYVDVSATSADDGVFEVEQGDTTHYWPFESIHHVTVEG